MFVFIGKEDKDNIKTNFFYPFGKQEDYFKVINYLSKDYNEIYCINISGGLFILYITLFK